MAKTIAEAFSKAIGRDDDVEPVLERQRAHLLMNATRRELLEELTFHPCVQANRLSRDLEVAFPTVKWHLGKLIDAGFLATSEVGKREVYFPDGLVEEADVKLLVGELNQVAAAMGAGRGKGGASAMTFIPRRLRLVTAL